METWHGKVQAGAWHGKSPSREFGTGKVQVWRLGTEKSKQGAWHGKVQAGSLARKSPSRELGTGKNPSMETWHGKVQAGSLARGKVQVTSSCSCDLSFVELSIAEASCELPLAGFPTDQLLLWLASVKLLLHQQSTRRQANQCFYIHIVLGFLLYFLYSDLAVAREIVARFLHPEGVLY
ncbi:hypothetical protein ZIOFF_069350 [Zingiber officinale]|uniref:Uncharacterized protein n=1 Tax=Zingiber officinale TaxID=94328 RepID=A0A8J5CB17_ZINOF|nr:hypothetical protein ZIOFF_069350 [Zingiber officinale]